MSQQPKTMSKQPKTMSQQQKTIPYQTVDCTSVDSQSYTTVINNAMTAENYVISLMNDAMYSKLSQYMPNLLIF